MAFTRLMILRMSDRYRRLPGQITDSVSELYQHTNIKTQSKELATLGSDLCRAHRPAGFLVLLWTVSQDSVMQADRKYCADAKQGAKLGLKHTKMKN